MKDAVKISLDRTGFPMVWVRPIKAWLHVLPLTKIQLEYFLVSTTDSDYDHKWYRKILGENQRVSPRHVNSRNYFQAFATALIPSEAETVAQWMGREFEIPTHKEWLTAYQYLRELPWDGCNWINGPKLHNRTATLLQNVDRAITDKTRDKAKRQTMADRMLMRWGVLEWVSYHAGRYDWGVYGETNRDFHSLMLSPDQGNPQGALQPEKDRFFYYGCRLLRRP